MDPVRLSLDQPVLRVADTVVTLGMALAGAGAAVVLLLLFVFLLARGSARRRAAAAEQAGAEAAARAAETEGRLSEILRTQAEMQGRMATIAEVFSTRQSEVNRSMVQQLVDQLFAGDRGALVHHLLTQHDIDNDELSELRRLIDEQATPGGESDDR